MPTYGYQCLDCSHSFELFQAITAIPQEDCPKCEGKVRRLIGRGAGVVFKGSGFYVNDYKKSNAKSQGKTDNAPAPSESKQTQGAKPSSEKKAEKASPKTGAVQASA